MACLLLIVQDLISLFDKGDLFKILPRIFDTQYGIGDSFDRIVKLFDQCFLGLAHWYIACFLFL